MSHHTVKVVVIAAAATAVAATMLIGIVALDAQEQQAARVFTAEQAAAGKSAFEKGCAVCHMRDLSGDADAPALAGPPFMSTWRTRTVKDLYEYMSTSMPPGGSTLGTDTYMALTAYVLQANGAVAGTTSLTPATAAPIGSVAAKKAGS